jgi:hypothetical protein
MLSGVVANTGIALHLYLRHALPGNERYLPFSAVFAFGAILAGAVFTSADVITAAEGIIGLREGVSVPSSFFIMVMPTPSFGENGVLIYADAGVNPNPSVEELAEIAILAALNAETLFGWLPRWRCSRILPGEVQPVLW